MRRFIEPLGIQVKGLIREVMVYVTLHWRAYRSPNVAPKDRGVYRDGNRAGRVFVGGLEIVLFNRDTNHLRTEIMDICQKRLLEAILREFGQGSGVQDRQTKRWSWCRWRSESSFYLFGNDWSWFHSAETFATLDFRVDLLTLSFKPQLLSRRRAYLISQPCLKFLALHKWEYEPG